MFDMHSALSSAQAVFRLSVAEDLRLETNKRLQSLKKTSADIPSMLGTSASTSRFNDPEEAGGTDESNA
jgi:hypothetical protein